MPRRSPQPLPPPRACPKNRISASDRAAFSRIELAIVLLIVAVLASLFMMFVPRFREQANQRQCANNLRQIGMAIHLFRDNGTPRSLPAARIADRYATWAVQVAPYLGGRQAEPLRAWDPSKPYAVQPDDVRQVQLRLFYCPSRRLPGHNSISGDFADNKPGNQTHYPGGLLDYACAAGDGDPRFSWTGPEANGSIVLGEVLKKGPGDTIERWRSRTDLAVEKAGDRSTIINVGKAHGKPGSIKQELARGTSQTALIGEKHVRPDDFGKAEEGDGSGYNGGRPASFARIAGKGHKLARTITDPIDLNYPIFGSYHPGICHFLMADGSVRPVQVMIKGNMLATMVTRDE